MNKKGQAKRVGESLANRISDSKKKQQEPPPIAGGPPPLPKMQKAGQAAQADPQKNTDETQKSVSGRKMPPPIPPQKPSPKPSPLRRSPAQPAAEPYQSHNIAGKPNPLEKGASQAFKSEPVQNKPGYDPAVPAGIRPAPRYEPPSPSEADDAETGRRAAKRRPAGPSRDRIAANDDAPSIGGLIYAINQKPSKKPFVYAGIATGVWVVIAIGFILAFMGGSAETAYGLQDVIIGPTLPTAVATVLGPIVLFWFLAFLMWRTEELHLRSTAMTEVAMRLAEPDQAAEQSVASLGQAVRRQVTFMNDAVTRALGRAGELEALVHNEVNMLEKSYEDNERKIRGLIQELSGERHALQNTGDGFKDTLVQLGAEVPQLIENMSRQQLKLAQIIEHAGTNLTQLEGAIGGQTEKLETSLGDNTRKLQTVLESYTTGLAAALGTRTQQMQDLLEDSQRQIDTSIEGIGSQLGTSVEQIETRLGSRVEQFENRLGQAARQIDGTLDTTLQHINDSLAGRTETMQSVLEQYAHALDETLANRTNMFDTQLVERTKALDEAFSERLRLFDEAIMRSTVSIDQSIGESARSLTNSIEHHAGALNETLSHQASHLDDTLVRGIESVRSTSENISRQSIKAIEGLASQSDMLRSVSENVLNQLSGVSNRFENQSNAIMRSANSLEAANYRINQMLTDRSTEINTTLENMSDRAEELGSAFSTYTQNLEGSISQAHEKAKSITQDLTRETEEQARATVDNLQRLKAEAMREADQTLQDLRNEFSAVSHEVSDRLGTLSDQFSKATGEVRQRVALAAQQLEEEQGRLKDQLDSLPQASEESAAAMRKALQDQLKALDQLTELAHRTSLQSAVMPTSSEPPLPLEEAVPQPRQQVTSDQARPLKTLTSTLAREMNERNQTLSSLSEPTAYGSDYEARDQGTNTEQQKSFQDFNSDQRGVGADFQSPSQGQGEADAYQSTGGNESSAKWSLGELLSRVPEDEHGSDVNRAPVSESTSSAQVHQHQTQEKHQSIQDTALDIVSIARALEPGTAAAIWSRFRSGQRGFMVRSIYAPDSRRSFDDIVYRYQSQPTFRANVDRFVQDFEQTLRESDQRDASGELTMSHIVSEAGRVYLLLAHASQRLM